MAKKKRLSLDIAKQVAGVGAFVEEPIKFLDKNGQEFNCDVLVKRLSHDERIEALKIWDLPEDQPFTIDHLQRAYVKASVYTDEETALFPDIESTGSVLPELLMALYEASNKVNDYSGKTWISNQKNSGANSSSTESVDEPSKKPSGT